MHIDTSLRNRNIDLQQPGASIHGFTVFKAHRRGRDDSILGGVSARGFRIESNKARGEPPWIGHGGSLRRNCAVEKRISGGRCWAPSPTDIRLTDFACADAVGRGAGIPTGTHLDLDGDAISRFECHGAHSIARAGVGGTRAATRPVHGERVVHRQLAQPNFIGARTAGRECPPLLIRR